MIEQKTILILGGGISGLSLAYYLSRSGSFKVDLIEKQDRLGGWIDSEEIAGFFFEKGPRIFRGSKSGALLSLVKEIGMENEMIQANTSASSRFFWIDGKLHKIPKLSWDLIKGVVRELRVKPVEEDESVWDFACRRFNPTVAAHVFDPMMVGIYGGGIKEASIESCFPRFKQWERDHGSVIKGALKSKRSSSPVMISFRRGMKSVIKRLEEITPVEIHREEEVISIDYKDDRWAVQTTKSNYVADYLFSALPCQVIGKLLVPELMKIPLRGATVVNLGYDKDVIRKKGFGYLVSSTEESEIMGAIFDSVTFPQLNRGGHESRITVMLRPDNISDEQAHDLAIRGLKSHLKMTHHPIVSLVTKAYHAFPQLKVGHFQRMQEIERRMKEKHPTLYLAGNYLYGVGVSDCIERAKSVSANFLNDVESWSKSSGV